MRKTQFSSYVTQKALAAHLFVLPAVLFFLVWYIYPMLRGIWITLYAWNIVTPPLWVGWQNYQTLVQDEEFWASVGKTAYYALSMPLKVLLALVMNARIPLRGLFRTLYFIPVVTSDLATALIWKWVYDPHFGLLAGIMRPLGLEPIPWLTSTTWAMPAIILYGVWGGLGYIMVLFLAGLQGIPPELYEAASMDGADGWRRFRHITLPLLRPILLFILITSTITAAQVFTPAYAMTRGGPVGATRVVGLLIYQTGFEYLKMGYATTMALFMFLIMGAAALIQRRVVGQHDS